MQHYILCSLIALCLLSCSYDDRRADVRSSDRSRGTEADRDSLAVVDSASSSLNPDFFNPLWEGCFDMDKDFHDFLLDVENRYDLDSSAYSRWVPKELYRRWGMVVGVVDWPLDSCRGAEVHLRSPLHQGVACILYDRGGVTRDVFVVGYAEDTLTAFMSGDKDGAAVVYRADAPRGGFDRSRPIPDSLWNVVYRLTRGPDLKYDVDTVR